MEAIVDIQTSKFNVEHLPTADDSIEPDLAAYACARRDTETLLNELAARGYSKAESIRGVRAALEKFVEAPSS
jgi:hypothetical protein